MPQLLSQLSLVLAKSLNCTMDISPNRITPSPPTADGLVTSPFRVADPPVVLVVDDSEDNLQLACYIVEQAGYSPLSAGSGKDALAQVEEHSVSLILLDIILPDMDGYEVLAQVRQQMPGTALPIIATTALASEAEKQQMIQAGFTSTLCKPYAIDDLEALLRQHCPVEAPVSLRFAS